MPDKAINRRSATGFLVILLPAALAMATLFTLWPLILGLTIVAAGGTIWQNFEWSKTIRSIDPTFQQLIVQNRGEITPIDLALKANIPGKVATRYLVTKADEFGTSSRQYADRGQVFYFMSVSTLGAIFDDSERDEPTAAIMPATNSVVSTPATSTETALEHTEIAPTHQAISTSLPQPEPPVVQRSVSDLSNLARLLDEQPVTATATKVDPETALEPSATGTTSTASALDPADPVVPQQSVATIVQSELAKRLDVHSSTIYKRRSEPNFIDWTRNRDPDGLAWGYDESNKEYYRVDT